MDEEPKEQAEPGIEDQKFARGDEFESLYANNVTLEATALDLKMVFGEIDLRRQLVEQHTAITIPWVQAKILSYYLGIFIAQHEAQSGKVTIPASVLPPLIPIPDGATPKMRAIYELAQDLHHRLVADVAIVAP
jgi:hypothetical protein